MDSYVVIIVPSEKILKFVDRYRKKNAKYTNYVISPHITIYPPFYLEGSSEEEVISLLKNEFLGTEPKIINFPSVNYFEGKNNVAYFGPDEQSLRYLKSFLIKTTKALKGKIKNVYDDYNFTPEKFKPHMTIAEKIPSKILPLVKEKLAKLDTSLSFDVTAIFLYGQKMRSVIWNRVEKISF